MSENIILSNEVDFDHNALYDVQGIEIVDNEKRAKDTLEHSEVSLVLWVNRYID